jgi:hypothetical protein
MPRPLVSRAALAALAVAAGLGAGAPPAGAGILAVTEGESIQAAIDAAAPGDTITVGAGVYSEDLDFRGKAVTVAGAGPASVLQGTGTGPVVRFTSGETAESVLDSFTVTGGNALRGGGILISGGSPTVLRNVIAHNRALGQGSGIYVEASTARIFNNLLVYNRSAGGDPHSIQILNAAPLVVNNTIARGDSNAILTSGASPAVIMNNVIAYNGAVVDREGRGRGICDFSAGGSATIAYNVFHRNRVAALLTNGRDFRRIGRAEREIGPPRLFGNLDGNPGFVRRRPPRIADPRALATTPADFTLRAMGARRAVDAGNPDPAHDDLDGTRNDAGFTGGPTAPAWW